MGFKRGDTGKLVYDFPTQAVLEVQTKTNWYRTTGREFRSFDGPRRYTQPIKQPGITGSMFDVPTETIEYDGPLYALGTNLKVPKQNTRQLASSEYLEQARKISKKHSKRNL